MSCPSWSQHIVLIRYIYLWRFVTIFLKVKTLWPTYKQYFAKERKFSSKNQVIVFVHSTWSWWDKSFPSGCRVMTLHSWTDYGRTDGRTNTIFIGQSLTTGRAMPNICQNRRPYRTQTLFHFSASPSPFLGTTENATFAHFMKKSMHFKTVFL